MIGRPSFALELLSDGSVTLVSSSNLTIDRRLLLARLKKSLIVVGYRIRFEPFTDFNPCVCDAIGGWTRFELYARYNRNPSWCLCSTRPVAAGVERSIHDAFTPRQRDPNGPV
jgi:hypothetical protein